jgi:DNA-binding NarL/FixJ family response regulator
MQEARRALALRDAIADMVFVIDAEGRYTGFTPGVGVAPIVPPALFLGRLVSEVLPPAVAQTAMQAIRAAIDTQTLQVINYELWEGDTLRQYECRIVAAGTEEVVAVVRDETARSLLGVERRREVESLESRAEAALTGENPFSLSFRELIVLDLLVEGLADKEISAKLNCSRFTVNKHVASILTKMGARSRTEAAVRAIRLGLIPLVG